MAFSTNNQWSHLFFDSLKKTSLTDYKKVWLLLQRKKFPSSFEEGSFEEVEFCL